MSRTQAMRTLALAGVLALTFSLAAKGQDHRIRFDHLTLSDGLSQASGNAILQDSRGFLWIGTEDGLNRFDGYEVEVFRHDPDDAKSLADNFVTALVEDPDQRLWIFFSQPGLVSIFDLETERFERLQHDPDDPSSFPFSFVTSGQTANDRSRWIGTRTAGIAKIDPDTLLVTPVRHDPDDAQSLTSDSITSVLSARDGTLWLTTADGTLHRRLEHQTGNPERFERFPRFPRFPSAEPRSYTSLLEDTDGLLWIGTVGSGLIRFDPSTGQSRTLLNGPEASPAGRSTRVITETGHGDSGVENVWVGTGESLVRIDRRTLAVRRYRHDPKDPHSLSSERFRAFAKDSSGALWIGTEGGGLNRWDPETDRFTVYRNHPSDASSLSNDFVRNLYFDRSGILWIGTYGGGIDHYSPNKHKFTLYRQDPDDPESLDNNTVFPVYEDRHSTLWVGTLGGGLNRFNADRQKISTTYIDPTGRSRPACLFEDREGRFWIGTTSSGLLLFDRDTEQVSRRFVNDPEDENSLPASSIAAINQDSRGALWLSAGQAWTRFDPETGFKAFRHNPEEASSLALAGIRLTHEDRDGELWITHTQGISRFHRETETFSHFTADPGNPSSLSHNTVMGIYEDADGFFWITTYGGGLNRFNPKTGTAQIFTTKHGLPSDALYGILPDDDGNLWISSNGGLVRLDPRILEFKSFDVNDGLQSNEFNERSSHRGRDGRLYFGGVQGLNSFRPNQLKSSSYKPPMVITSLIRAGRREKLKRIGGKNARLIVSYKENEFSFEFSSLDLSAPKKNLYAYKLEGFDHQWVQAGTRRFAGYTNLDGGDYVFHVKGTNSDGVWNDEGASIPITVTTPPWKTWWAFCLYALVLIGAVLAYVRHQARVHREELRRQQEEAERLRQIDRMKDELLANTSHELRTPLNGIIGITQSLLDGATGKLAEATRSNLSMVVSSGRRLAHLVDDILDFSKLRKHQIELRRTRLDLRELTDGIIQLSQPLVTGRNLKLQNLVPKDLPKIDADSDRVQQIFHNVIGNAVKFTQQGGVHVSADTLDGWVEVTVADTGIGIAADQLERVFDSFAQADGSGARTFGGTGLGLTITRQLVELHGGAIRMESEPGKGTRVLFTLPTWQEDGTAPSAHPRPQRQTPAPSMMLSQVRDLEPVEPLGLEQLTDSVEAEDSPGQDVHVMIVDDEPINLQVLRNILNLEGFKISQAYDGRQCLTQLDEDPLPDIILLDVMMPGMTGFAVTEEVRQRYSANDLPILLVTAKNQVSDLERGLTSGANDYLTKPFSRNELLARMRTHLSLARAHTMEAENRRKTEEFHQARAIQLSLLPKSPPTVPYLDIAAHMETATEVGGDYYDFFMQEDGGLYIVTGDATGHGISAGMVVSMTKSALKALDVQSPHILLRQLNQVLRAVQLERMHMALNVTYITDSEIAISSAAMPPSYLYRPGSGVQEILLPGLPLGGMGQAEYQLKVLEFHPGDTLLQISDGLPEWINDRGEMLGYEAIADCLSTHGDRSAQDILNELLNLGRRWAGRCPTGDDITAVVLKRR